MRAPFLYLLVAGICFVLHNVVMLAAYGFGAPLWLSVLLSFSAVALTGYVLHGLFTFRQRLAVIALVRYAAGMSANIPLAYLGTSLFHDGLGLAMVVAVPMGALCMLAFNFFLSRWAVRNPVSTLTVRP